MKLWSSLIEKCCFYCANKVKNSNFQSLRANNSGVTGRISLIIQLIRNLVPINTSCKFGPDWLRNVVARKKLMAARMHTQQTNRHDNSLTGQRPVALASVSWGLKRAANSFSWFHFEPQICLAYLDFHDPWKRNILYLSK